MSAIGERQVTGGNSGFCDFANLKMTPLSKF